LAYDYTQQHIYKPSASETRSKLPSADYTDDSISGFQFRYDIDTNMEQQLRGHLLKLTKRRASTEFIETPLFLRTCY